ncbi:MAG: S8 family serine peptidase [Saprospiraceae bacterium]|nr:S8 family serine peptidase [Saprospiraceae bacterium]MCF8249800.1 S8 family serine peptidase [Saprospiraceae bacterium]MCF8279285.1 S8 family serine peptidase [Bacteroidales bacterium]MCF8313449.1 S8 family serine peptidase [Saprospiraceae bacterium]MCF8442162.1 S8 family serine peptidase [Saprospiraceae bacterium]
MYTFTYGGKNGETFQLAEAKDLVVVRTKDDAPLETLSLSSQSRDIMPSLLPIAAFPEASVMVYRCIATEEKTATAMRNAARKNLSQEEGVRFAGRALKDPATGSIVVYTNNLYLQFKGDLLKKDCAAIMKKAGLKVKEDLGITPNSYFVEAPEGTGLGVFELAQNLLSLPEVEACHPELVRERKFKFVHPMQWHLRETQVNGVTISQHANVEAAWELSRGKGITIAVLDDGVDTSHPEFADKIVFPRDTVTNSDDAKPKSASERHGTACAGVAAASGNGKASGVAPEAKLMPIRLGSIGSISEAKAFKWAADNGADVISFSWGPEDGAWWSANDPLHTRQARLPDSAKAAIDYAVEKGRGGKGCVITWAAGNGNEDVKFDEYASYPKVIAVAACNDNGRRCVYSDFGDAVWCCFPSNDFFEPRLNPTRPNTPGIWTTDRTGKNGYNSGGINAEHLVGDLDGLYTATFGGTSSACPGVAGTAALMLAANPDLTWEQVKTVIRNSCDRIDEENGGYDANGHSPKYGYGRLNARKAVDNAIAAGQPKSDAPNFEVKGLAIFNKTKKAPLANDVAVGEFAKPERLLGLQLSLEPFHPDLHVSYKLMVKNIGETEAGTDGSASESTDRRRSVVGVSISLSGPMAINFKVKYAVKLKGKDKWVEAENGAWAGSGNLKKGATVEGVRVWI